LPHHSATIEHWHMLWSDNSCSVVRPFRNFKLQWNMAHWQAQLDLGWRSGPFIFTRQIFMLSTTDHLEYLGITKHAPCSHVGNFKVWLCYAHPEYTACAYNIRVTHRGGQVCSGADLNSGAGGQYTHSVSCGSSMSRYCSMTKACNFPFCSSLSQTS
jgi:hypothetical protein